MAKWKALESRLLRDWIGFVLKWWGSWRVDLPWTRHSSEHQLLFHPSCYNGYPRSQSYSSKLECCDKHVFFSSSRPCLSRIHSGRPPTSSTYLTTTTSSSSTTTRRPALPAKKCQRTRRFASSVAPSSASKGCAASSKGSVNAFGWVALLFKGHIRLYLKTQHGFYVVFLKMSYSASGLIFRSLMDIITLLYKIRTCMLGWRCWVQMTMWFGEEVVRVCL